MSANIYEALSEEVAAAPKGAKAAAPAAAPAKPAAAKPLVGGAKKGDSGARTLSAIVFYAFRLRRDR